MTDLPDATDVLDDEGPSTGLWQKMKADPEYAPEHLALEAVARLGPRMVAALAKLRAQNPGAPPDALAGMIMYRYVNHARLSGAVSGAAGLAGAVLDVGVLAWTQAKMVLLIAAAYGADPADPERATELLVLQGVHKYADGARTALAVARGRENVDALLPADRPPVSRMLMRLGVKLAQMAGIRAAKKVFAKVIPGAAIILGSVANASATKSLGQRAIGTYRRPFLALPGQPPAWPTAPSPMPATAIPMPTPPMPALPAAPGSAGSASGGVAGSMGSDVGGSALEGAPDALR